MDTNLGNIITNPLARKVIYSVYVIAGLALGGIQAWYGAGAVPEWFPQALALYGYLGIPIGGLAVANTPKASMALGFPTPVPPPLEPPVISD